MGSLDFHPFFHLSVMVLYKEGYWRTCVTIKTANPLLVPAEATWEAIMKHSYVSSQGNISEGLLGSWNSYLHTAVLRSLPHTWLDINMG